MKKKFCATAVLSLSSYFKMLPFSLSLWSVFLGVMFFNSYVAASKFEAIESTSKCTKGLMLKLDDEFGYEALVTFSSEGKLAIFKTIDKLVQLFEKHKFDAFVQSGILYCSQTALNILAKVGHFNVVLRRGIVGISSTKDVRIHSGKEFIVGPFVILQTMHEKVPYFKIKRRSFEFVEATPIGDRNIKLKFRSDKPSYFISVPETINPMNQAIQVVQHPEWESSTSEFFSAIIKVNDPSLLDRPTFKFSLFNVTNFAERSIEFNFIEKPYSFRAKLNGDIVDGTVNYLLNDNLILSASGGPDLYKELQTLSYEFLDKNNSIISSGIMNNDDPSKGTLLSLNSRNLATLKLTAVFNGLKMKEQVFNLAIAMVKASLNVPNRFIPGQSIDISSSFSLGENHNNFSLPFTLSIARDSVIVHQWNWNVAKGSDNRFSISVSKLFEEFLRKQSRTTPFGTYSVSLQSRDYPEASYSSSFEVLRSRLSDLHCVHTQRNERIVPAKVRCTWNVVQNCSAPFQVMVKVFDNNSPYIFYSRQLNYETGSLEFSETEFSKSYYDEEFFVTLSYVDPLVLSEVNEDYSESIEFKPRFNFRMRDKLPVRPPSPVASSPTLNPKFKVDREKSRILILASSTGIAVFAVLVIVGSLIFRHKKKYGFTRARKEPVFHGNPLYVSKFENQFTERNRREI